MLKPHPVFNVYSISEDGRVFRNFVRGKAITPREIVQNKSNRGYMRVTLSIKDKRYDCCVHRLVLETFIGKQPVGKESAHLDGCRTNNHRTNLMWCTRKENHAHKKLHGTDQSGERSGNSVMSNRSRRFVLYLVSIGIRQNVIARCFQVSEYCISNIKNKQAHRYIQQLETEGNDERA